ncbi:metallophosphoesterase family protein [Sulfitobacter sp. JB4-11]|uniref:metallophosphoesterase family protein n=1 Tax=Sulfitobacter rhodophyticola TaxID=3238304 RepID=UPI003512E9A4
MLRFVRRQTDPAPQYAVDPGHCVYAIGDIHGRVDLLDTLIRQIILDKESDPAERQMFIVFLGDYIDRGDQSRETVNYLIQLQGAAGKNIVFLTGNHEAALLDFLDGKSAGSNWLDHGGRQTVASYGLKPPDASPTQAELDTLRLKLRPLMADHIGFFRALDMTWQSGNYFFCHAGVDPERRLTEQDPQSLLFGNRSFLENNGHSDAMVVHGHYAAAEPVTTPHRICIDTGAYYSGKLTAAKISDGVTFIRT